MRVLNVEQMRWLEGAIREELQVSSLELMKIAGQVVFDAIESEFGPYGKGQRATVLCGPGDNGGDGWLVARLLAECGAQVTAIANTPRTAEATECRRAAIGSGVRELVGDLRKIGLGSWEVDGVDVIDEVDLVVDGVFGLGLNRPVESGVWARVFKKLNQSVLQSRTLKVVSIDLPSGLGESIPLQRGYFDHKPRSHWVCPTMTVTFELPKIPHVLPPHSLFIGKLVIRPLAPSLREKEYDAYGSVFDNLVSQASELRVQSEVGERAGPPHLPQVYLLDDPADVALPERDGWSHKGDYGRVTIVAGSAGKVGAARLAGLGALRGGAGLVTVATPGSAVSEVTQTPELMTLALPDRHGKVMAKGAEVVLALKSDVVAIGPGLGNGAGATKLVLQLLDHYGGPLILDADALNVLDFGDEAIQKTFVQRSIRAYKTNQRYAVIMTPHLGEFSRLTGLTVDTINSDPIGASSEFARKWGVWIVLKGTRTILAKPTGDIVINTTGNPGMATAGCGDVLTGVIAACVAEEDVNTRFWNKRHPFDFKDMTDYENALRAYPDATEYSEHEQQVIPYGYAYTSGLLEAVYIHGRAGDLAARERGEVSLIASDVVNRLGDAFAEITVKTYPTDGVSGESVNHGYQAIRSWGRNPNDGALKSVGEEYLGCIALAKKFFGENAVSNSFAIE